MFARAVVSFEVGSACSFSGFSGAVVLSFIFLVLLDWFVALSSISLEIRESLMICAVTLRSLRHHFVLPPPMLVAPRVSSFLRSAFAPCLVQIYDVQYNSDSSSCVPSFMLLRLPSSPSGVASAHLAQDGIQSAGDIWNTDELWH